MAALTLVHVALSLIGLASGFVVIRALLEPRWLEGWTRVFLAATFLTSVTGFLFPFVVFLPSHGFGIVSLILLPLAVVARYGYRLAGGWGRTFVISAVAAQYLNFFVLIVQAFQKVPALRALAPTGTEPAFAAAQVVALIAFTWAGFRAVRKPIARGLPAARTSQRKHPVLFLMLFLACLAGCAGSGSEGAANAPPAFPVSVIAVEPEDVPIHQEYIGRTFSLNTVQVNARVNGYVDQWLFKPGDIVNANQLLYVIDQRTYQAEVQRAQAEVSRAEAQLSFAKEGVEVMRAESELAQAEATVIKADQDVARVKPLVEQRALPEQDLDAVNAAQKIARNDFLAREAALKQTRLTQRTNIEQSDAALRAARAALRQSELDLEFTEIRSPITGRIGETTIQVGGLVSANSPQPLTLVSPLDPIYVEFTVNERDYLSYVKDQAALGRTPRAALSAVPLHLTLSDGSVYPHVGVFQFADRSVDVATGTLKLTATFPNPTGIILPGQFSRVRMSTRTRTGVYTIPQKAVQEMQGLRYVMVVEESGLVAQRTVTATERLGTLWVIEEGLNRGDRVVVEGLQKALPGATVTPRLVAFERDGGVH